MNPRDWCYLGNVIDHGEPCKTCQLCGQMDLRYHFQIIHRTTADSLWIGSECIKQFNIDVIQSGQVLNQEAAFRAVDRDRRAMEQQAQTRSVLNALVQLAAVDEDFDIQSFINDYSSHGAFTPRQMFFIQWRFRDNRIDHNPKYFKVRLRRDREQDQLKSLEAWKRQKLAPYLSPPQRKRWLS